MEHLNPTAYSEINCRNIITLLTAFGYSPKAICAILANFYVESKLFPNNLQNSYNKHKDIMMSDEEFANAVESGKFDFRNSALGFGYGLAQWTSKGRRNGLYDYLKSYNKRIDDLAGQIDWFNIEMTTSYKAVYNYLNDNAHSTADMAEEILLKYEKPASVGANASAETKANAINQRRLLADEFYEKYFKMVEKEDNNMANKVVKIAINAGHYLYTPGKRIPKSLDPNETREWVLNDRICDKLENALKNYNVQVLRLDDTTGEKKIDVEPRMNMLNAFNPDIGISIHHNAGAKLTTSGGIVVYYNSNKGTTGVLAQRFYNSLLAAGSIRGNRSNPIKNQTSLMETNMAKGPYFLLENGFMDSKADAPVILTEEYANKTVQGIMNFLISEFGIEKNGEPSPEPLPSYIYYTVQKGDTLGKIATKYNVSVSAIVMMNNIVNPNLITVGQLLKIPSNGIPEKTTFKEGDIVHLLPNATYWNGKTIPNWVRKSTLYYRGSNKNGAIISTKKTGAITGVVDFVFLY